MELGTDIHYHQTMCREQEPKPHLQFMWNFAPLNFFFKVYINGNPWLGPAFEWKKLKRWIFCAILHCDMKMQSASAPINSRGQDHLMTLAKGHMS